MHYLNDSHSVFARYEALRERLPAMPLRTDAPMRVADLSAVFDRFDVFVLDGFGVLNVGSSAIPGACERVAAMRAAGKRVIVLTNAATFPGAMSVQKYRGLGFDFAAGDIVSSRDVAETAMAARPERFRWAATSAGAASIDGLDAVALDDDRAHEEADGIVFLSGDTWGLERQERLVAALQERARPVLVANPDLVAPRETGLSVEPGAWAHALIDEIPALDVAFYGKPFGNAFARVMEVLGDETPEPARIAMVGDTLHTDILGGAAAGWGTVLITDHGILRGHAPEPFIEASGIVPDVIAKTT